MSVLIVLGTLLVAGLSAGAFALRTYSFLIQPTYTEFASATAVITRLPLSYFADRPVGMTVD